MKNIIFLEEQFSLQGTTRALIDYAYFNEKILGNKSYLAFGKKIQSYPWSEDFYKKYLDQTFLSLTNRFNTFEYKNYNELENFIEKNKIDYLYNIKSGEPIGFQSKKCKNVYHAVFPQPIQNIHGDRYAYVSKWLSENCSDGKIPYVPHMVNVPKLENLEDIRKNIRKKYNIPNDSFVYGRIGGYNDFNLPFVHETILKCLEKRKDLYFVFICTKPFATHERIIYIEPILDIKEKYKHISMCDAMIHARHHGETFGLAIAEFCALNKPIITWKNGVGKGYIDILKDDGIYYENEDDLLDIFLNFVPDKNKDYNSYKMFSPENVMQQFYNVFLKNL
jgi:glycosyltransferase involved in cell wall biosynthesis